MDLLRLSKRERFYYDVGEALSMNDTRCFINVETMKVEINPGEDFFSEEEEDTAQEAMDNPDNYIPIDSITPREGFKIMEGFVETVTDKHMQQRLSDTLEGQKPFANFNRLVHNSNVREHWFDFKNRAHIEMAKDWIEENASDELKEKIKALPAVSIGG
jgi:hypothetical protein